MSESPLQAEAVGVSSQIKNLRYLQIGAALLLVAAVCLLVVIGWFPNFLSFLNVPQEFFRYAAEIVGFYSFVFLLVGLIGAPGSPRDYFGGVAFVALALFAFEASRDLPGMRGFAFGPGTAPRIFSFMLGSLGAAVALTGLLTKGAGIDRFFIRGPFYVTLSVVLFAWMVRPLGLITASFLSICAAAGATPEARLLETLIWGAVLTAFCSFLFVYALNLPMQMGPITCDPTVLFKGQKFECDPAALIKGLSTIR